MEQLSMFDFLDESEREKYKPIKSDDWKWRFEDYPTPITKKNSNDNINVFSFFSCGGGSTMGYKLAGCKVLGNCELDKRINELYVSNHHPKYNYCMDIRDFNAMDNSLLPDELFELDILDGSPPCSTFSMAGSRSKSWGVEKVFREGQKKQTLDDLPFIFIETVNKLKPKCVIMENVEGMLNGDAFMYVQEIYRQFTLIGYDVKHYLLKAERMGVPQTRHRIFFVAVKKELKKDFAKLDMEFNYESVIYGEIKSGVPRKIKEGTTLRKLIDNAKYGDGDLSDVSARILNRPNSFFTYRLQYDDKVMSTVTAHEKSLISFSDREYVSSEDIIHASTFPEDYDFGTFINPDYVCGMSVPPVMMKRIADRVINWMNFTK